MNIKSRLRRLFNRPAAVVRNDAGERIESLRFTVPALRVGVLEYAPGQLTTGNKKLDGKTVKLYYPPESVSDEKFLKSLETAPVVVGSHETTTNENNKKIDGWAHTVSYDDSQGAAMIAGVVKGNKEVAYIKGNLKQKDFGASAFVDIYDMEIKSGVTPDGQEYNAIARDLRATHVALAPHVRDPENKIKVTNAVVLNTDGTVEEVENAGRGRKILKLDGKEYETIEFATRSAAEAWIAAHGGKMIFSRAHEYYVTVQNSHGENFNNEEYSMDPKEIAALVKNAVEEALAAKNAEDRMKELEEEVKNLKAKNEAYEGKETEEEEKEEKKAENSDEEKKEEKEDATLENAMPTQELVKAVGTALNIDFGSKTPSFKSLAGMLGIKEDDPALRIAAVNAKYAEIVNKKPATVQNAGTVEVF